MRTFFKEIAAVSTFAFMPHVSLCQTDNPRGIYKLTSIETSQATVTDYKDQYKVCTDSITLNILIDGAARNFSFSRNTIYDYTGDIPATPDDKSDLIFDSDQQHFTLKWWVPEVPARQESFPVFVPNEWCIEKYQSGLFSNDGKVIFDAITHLQQEDKENPLLGTWRNIGVLFSLGEEEIAHLKKGYPNSELYNKNFYVFTPTHWLATMEVDNTLFGQYHQVTYLNHETINDNVSIVPTQLVWLSDDCVAFTSVGANPPTYVVLERVKDGVPVLNRLAYWLVPRDFNWYLQKAEAGNHVMQYQVGCAYISGTGVESDVQRGLDFVLKSAEGEYKQAQYIIGLAYLKGEYVEQNPEKGFSWLYKAAVQNEPLAQAMVGACYIDGTGVEKNEAEGFKWFEKSANGGNTWAQTVIGEYYNRADLGNDPSKAFFYYMKAAQQGDAEAQNEVGVMYARGKGVEKNNEKAIEWYQKAAEQGYAISQYNLADRYLYGNGVEKNPQKAFELYLKAAEGGYASAQNDVAWMLYTGEDVPQDLPKAFEWAQKAVEQGNPYGYGTLAEMYYKGKGVKQDKAKAFELYSKGAELNDVESMRMLAIMYKKGEGTKKDEKQAAYWQKEYEKAQSEEMDGAAINEAN